MKENATSPYPPKGICSLTYSISDKSANDKILTWTYKLWIQNYALEIFDVIQKKKKAAPKKKTTKQISKTFNNPMTMISDLIQGFFIGFRAPLTAEIFKLKDLVERNTFYDKNNLGQVIEL